MPPTLPAMSTAATRTTRVRGAAVAVVSRAPGAVTLAGAAAAASLAALVVMTAGDGWGLPASRQTVVDLAVALGYAPMGALVLLARDLPAGTRQLARVLLVSGAASALTALAAASALVAREATPTVEVLAQLQSWLWVPGFLPLLTLVPLLYPDGLLGGRVWRAGAIASVVGMVALAAGVALYPEALAGHVRIDKPVTWSAGATVLTVFGAVLLVPSALIALAGLGLRWRRSEGVRRRQVVLLVVAVAVLAVVTAGQVVLPAPADALTQAVAVALVPVAIGVAVTRHRLYELDLAICRALVGVSLAACLAGLYLTLFALLRAATPDGSALATAVAAGVTGVLVQPLARRLSAGVDRLYYGDRADPGHERRRARGWRMR